jgi:hypothetical protein
MHFMIQYDMMYVHRLKAEQLASIHTHTILRIVEWSGERRNMPT